VLKEYAPPNDETIAKMTRIRFATAYAPVAMSASDLMFPGF
jgi:hypothetical protein